MLNSGRTEAFIEQVKEFAEQYLQYGSDHRHGSPLLANAVDPATKEHAIYDSDDIKSKGERLANTASQSNMLRMLQGLSELTGEARYKERADDIRRFMFSHQKDRNGLLYWGGHNAYLLDEGRSEYERRPSKTVHELKCHYPDYEAMWEIDADATRAYIEAVWNAHVSDWSQLDFNRHGSYNADIGKLWDHEYKPGDIFFKGKGRTFVNAGSDLYYAAAMLAHLSDDEKPLAWAKRLAKRYIETRQGDVGISGYQFSYKASIPDRAEHQIGPNIPAGHLVNEGTMFRPRPPVQRCQLQLAERLGSAGAEFLEWSISEMTAWGEKAYRKEDNSFIPMLTDGYVLEGVALARGDYFGPKGKVFEKMHADEDFFWLYAHGYRVTGDTFLWKMARDIASGLGLGDIGEKEAVNVKLSSKALVDHRAIFGLIELYRATEAERYLACAIDLGEQLLAETVQDRWFYEAGLSPANHPLPLALLYLAAEVQGANEKSQTVFAHLPIHTRNMRNRKSKRRV